MIHWPPAAASDGLTAQFVWRQSSERQRSAPFITRLLTQGAPGQSAAGLVRRRDQSEARIQITWQLPRPIRSRDFPPPGGINPISRVNNKPSTIMIIMVTGVSLSGRCHPPSRSRGWYSPCRSRGCHYQRRGPRGRCCCCSGWQSFVWILFNLWQTVILISPARRYSFGF